MIAVRKAEERGHANHGWLDTHHTFSFASYYDPKHNGFRSLLVINDDIVEPKGGFPTHAHSDMEIITVILEGALEHKDTMGTTQVIRPGEVQRMTAGRGIAHSEYNPSAEERVRLLQIWILPEKKRLAPGYEQKDFPVESRRGQLKLVASHDGREGSLTVHQDVNLYASVLGQGESVNLPVAAGRGVWIQVTKGSLTVNGKTLRDSDGAAITDEQSLTLVGSGDGNGHGLPAEFLLFDLA